MVAVVQTVATYNVPGENRGRNAEEIASGQLPVRHIRDKGYLGYLVNMIQVGLIKTLLQVCRCPAILKMELLTLMFYAFFVCRPPR